MDFQERQVFQERQAFKASMVYQVLLAQLAQQVQQVEKIIKKLHTFLNIQTFVKLARHFQDLQVFQVPLAYRGFPPSLGLTRMTMKKQQK
jgi:hypothetical protein